jgi:HAD superfamily hydrolase (TIGR01484 family)
MALDRIGTSEQHETPDHLEFLRRHLAHGSREPIALRWSPQETVERLRRVQRFYLDLDDTMLRTWATEFDDDTLNAFHLAISAEKDITFLSGKPLEEIQDLIDNLPPELAAAIKIVYEKGAYRYEGPERPDVRLLATEENERLIAGLKIECYEEWNKVIRDKHGVKLVPAGASRNPGGHRSVLSLDVYYPDAPDPSTLPVHERDRHKIKSRNVIAAVMHTVETELIPARQRALPISGTDLGNGNLEFHASEIDKDAALVSLEGERQTEEGDAMVVGDSGNDLKVFRAAGKLKHVRRGLVFHETTPAGMIEESDLAVVGKARGHRILDTVLLAQGRSAAVHFLSNTPSLEYDAKLNEYKERMGAPKVIGASVQRTRNALWYFPSVNGAARKLWEYPDQSINRKFMPVTINPDEHESQYNKISNSGWWAWAHPNTFETIETFSEDHWERYRKVSRDIADEMHATLLTDDLTLVSSHDFQVAPVAAEFRARHGRENIRFHIFWHVPFPSVEQAKRMPLDKVVRLLKDLEAYDVVGFHTQAYADNYLALCGALAEHGVRPSQIQVQPISVDVEQIRKVAVEIATAKDFRFDTKELNDFFQLDLPPERREDAELEPPERIDPIKGTFYRHQARAELAQEDPRLFDNKRFLSIMLPSRWERNPDGSVNENGIYAKNFRDTERQMHATNAALGRRIVFDVERIQGIYNLIGAMYLSKRKSNVSLDEGFGMNDAEYMLTAAATHHLPNAPLRQVYSTENAGFPRALAEQGRLNVMTLVKNPNDKKELKTVMARSLRGELPQPDYAKLNVFFDEFSWANWIQNLVRGHAQRVLPAHILDANRAG